MSKPVNKLGYNLSPGKVIKLLDKGRQKWRQKALIRCHEIRKAKWYIRDLERSREYWKELALMQRGLCHSGKYPPHAADSTSNSTTMSYPCSGASFGLVPVEASISMEVPVKGYQYPLWQVWSSAQWYLFSSSGYRCIGRQWELLSGVIQLKPPSFLAVRQWVLRIGHYKLHQAVERANDWIFIVDYTHQIGFEQCLLVLGVRLEDFRSGENRVLDASRVQVLDISLSRWANGEHLCSRLKWVEQRTGTPVQIVADGGSSIKKGIRLYAQHLEAPPFYTYDISHQAALLLEALLGKHPQWLLLVQLLNQLQKSALQTHAAFIIPPSLRKTARYMNLFEVVQWTSNLMHYQQKGDFSLLANNWQMEAAALDQWLEEEHIRIDSSVRDTLLALKATTEQAAKKLIKEQLEHFQVAETTKLPLCHNGLEQFRRFFSPILGLRFFLLCLQQLMDFVKCLLMDFKEQGLSKSLLKQWQEFPGEMLEEPARLFFQAWMEKMQAQMETLPDEMPYLATSDIIESVFGNYKATCDKYWLQGISPNILMMPAFVGKLNPEIVSEALLKTRYHQVQNWFDQQRLEKSFLAKRRKALSMHPKRLKTVGT